MKISACWIAKNEADNIKLSIESLIDIVDELIVVDTGSTDDTVQIAESLGARVEHFEWINDFSAARNYAISFATGDIIIFLDADEWFEPKLTSADRSLIEKTFKNPKIDFISVQIKNIDKISDCVLNFTVVDRIFKNKKNIYYKCKIHEHLDTPGGIKGCFVANSLGINHSGYSKNLFSQKLAVTSIY